MEKWVDDSREEKKENGCQPRKKKGKLGEMDGREEKKELMLWEMGQRREKQEGEMNDKRKEGRDKCKQKGKGKQNYLQQMNEKQLRMKIKKTKRPGKEGRN